MRCRAVDGGRLGSLKRGGGGSWNIDRRVAGDSSLESVTVVVKCQPGVL